MTTLELEVKLMDYFDVRRNNIIPNVSNWSNTPILFETDLLVLTPQGYATGIEIKVSKADLKNDLKKPQIKGLDNDIFNNHFRMFYGCFKHFYYAVPEELKDFALSQIPSYFGLLICKEFINDSYSYTKIIEIRPSKVLNNYQWSERQRMEILRLGIMRISTLKKRLLSYQRLKKGVV